MTLRARMRGWAESVGVSHSTWRSAYSTSTRSSTNTLFVICNSADTAIPPFFLRHGSGRQQPTWVVKVVGDGGHEEGKALEPGEHHLVANTPGMGAGVGVGVGVECG